MTVTKRNKSKSSVKSWTNGVRPLADLVPYKKNPRAHTEEDTTALADAIKRFGFTAPILIDKKNRILAGHNRCLAAAKLGMKTVPVRIIGDDWTAAEKSAYTIWDNQSTIRGTWDLDLLKTELIELKTSDVDLSILGFSLDDLALYTADEPTGADPEEVPDLPKNPVSRLGDLWILGDKHRILCGDSLKAEDVDRLLDGNIHELSNCDPPYGVNIVKASADGGRKPFGSIGNKRRANDPKNINNANGGRVHGLGRAGFGRVTVNAAKAIIQTGVYAAVIGDDSTQTAISCFEMLSRVKVPTVILWGGNYYANALPPSRCWFVWDKEVTGSFADVELAWTNCDQVARIFRHQWNGLMKASERGEKRVHPTQKPVALAEWVIETAAPRAKTVVDLFVGSGSGLIACERKNLKFFGMEMAPSYVDCAVIRWQLLTGKEAVLHATGQTSLPNAQKRGPQRREPRSQSLGRLRRSDYHDRVVPRQLARLLFLP